MRVLLTAASLLCALIAGVNCLLCEKCFAVDTASCSGIYSLCPPGTTHCVQGIENTTSRSRSILTAFKDCGTPSSRTVCGKVLSFRSMEALVRISRTCCDSDYCNSGEIQAPTVDETPNGYKCRDCFNDQSTDACTTKKEILCYGEEKACGFFSGTAAQPGEVEKEYNVAGCVTRDFCKLGAFNLAGLQLLNYHLKCSPAINV